MEPTSDGFFEWRLTGVTELFEVAIETAEAEAEDDDDDDDDDDEEEEEMPVAKP